MYSKRSGTLRNALKVQGIPALQHSKYRGSLPTALKVQGTVVVANIVQWMQHMIHTYTCSALRSKYSFQRFAVIFDISQLTVTTTSI